MTETRSEREFRLAQALRPSVEPKEVTVSWREYEDLLQAALMLSLLEREGVEQWEGYGRAHEAYGDLTDWPLS